MPVVISGTNGVSGVDGTASNPSYEGTDSNTGIFFPAADTIAFAEGGTEVARFDSSGNFGVGTSSPSYRLDVVNSAVNAIFGLRVKTTGTGGEALIDLDSTASSAPAYLRFLANATERARINSGGGNELIFSRGSGPTESMRIDGSGNVGIGTSSPTSFSATSKTLQVSSANTGYGTVLVDSNGTAIGQFFASTDGTPYVMVGARSNHALLLSTNNTERARIDASGNLLVGVTSTFSTVGVTTTNTFSTSGAASWAGAFQNTNSGPVGVLVRYNTDTNGTGNAFLYCQGNATLRAEIRSNGGLANFSANNVNLSDERLKTDIQPAGSYLSKICAIPVKTFLYKDQTDSEPNLGVIAQDVEAVAPELVDASGFGETPEDGVPYKTIYQTDLQYALMKCIQEQQQMIETLQAKVAALEAK